MEPLVAILLDLFTWLRYLTLHIFVYVLLAVLFFRVERRIRVALLVYWGILANYMATSRSMRNIWDVYSVLPFYPYLGHNLWGSTKNDTQFVEGKVEDKFSKIFTPFSCFRPVTTACKNFEFPLDVKDSMFLLQSLPGPLSEVHTKFRVRTEIYRLFRDLT